MRAGPEIRILERVVLLECPEAQIRCLRRRRPDIVALAEVGRNHVVDYAETLAALGLVDWRNSPRDIDTPPPGAGSERNRNLIIASRWPLAEVGQIAAPWPERALSVLVRSPWRPIEVHAVHMPTGRGWGFTKIETFEAVYRALGRRTPRARILCGDFNSPQEELPDGHVGTTAAEALLLT